MEERQAAIQARKEKRLLRGVSRGVARRECSIQINLGLGSLFFGIGECIATATFFDGPLVLVVVLFEPLSGLDINDKFCVHFHASVRSWENFGAWFSSLRDRSAAHPPRPSVFA